MRDYTAIDGRVQHEIVINRSRFIATVAYVKDFDEAMEFIKEIKKTYATATHNCYAFISNGTGAEQRFSDDGEPQGTAGQPILEVLKKKELCCTAAVVTRYFGGVKLGAGGLVSAYTRVVAEAVELAPRVVYKESEILRLSFGYDGYNTLLQLLKSIENKVLSTDFGDNVVAEVAVPKALADDLNDKINDAFCGQCKVERIKTESIKYDKI